MTQSARLGDTWFLCLFLMTWVLTLLGGKLLLLVHFSDFYPLFLVVVQQSKLLLAFLVKLFPMLTLFGRTTVFESCLWYVLAATITLISHFSFSKSWFLNIQIRRNTLLPKIFPSWDSMTSWHWISCPDCWHHVFSLPCLMGAVATQTYWLVVGLISFSPLPSPESPGLFGIVSL